VNVRELLEILQDYPHDLEVELAVIAPVVEDDDDIAVDRYVIEGVMPWDDDDGEFVWLVGGEEDDVEAFINAIEDGEDEEEEDAETTDGR
jgi:hypothetical protein